MSAKDTTSDKEELPPFIRSWNQLYRFIILILIVLIAAFYLFMKTFQ